MKQIITLGKTFDEPTATLVNEQEPRTLLDCVSIDTHAIGVVLRKLPVYR